MQPLSGRVEPKLAAADWLFGPRDDLSVRAAAGGEEVDENDLAELWRTENEEEGGFEDAPESASLADSDVTGLAPLGPGVQFANGRRHFYYSLL